MQNLSALGRIDLLLYSLALLGILFFLVRKNISPESLSSRLYFRIILSLAFIIIVETPVWLADPSNISYRPLFYVLLYLSLSLSSLPTVAWMTYFDYKIFQDYQASLRRTRYYLLTTLIIALVVFYNHFNRGFVFLLDDSNHIVWGIGSILIPVIVYIAILLVLIHFFRRKNMVQGRIIQTMLLYLLLPFIGSLLQMVFKGVSLNWPFYTLAVLMNYMILEKSEMVKDELTNLPTRSQLEERIRYKIRNREPFSVIMTDLNDFKSINDNFGHLEGDRVLKNVASILKADTNPEDTVCRFGGDEFLILIESEIENIGEKVIQRIDTSLNDLNRHQIGYQIRMSYGCEFVGNPGDCTINTLFSTIDSRMYADKKERKRGSV